MSPLSLLHTFHCLLSYWSITRLCRRHRKASTTEKTTGLYSKVHTMAKKPNPPTAAARHMAPPTTILGTIELPAMFLSGSGHQVAGAVLKVHALWVR